MDLNADAHAPAADFALAPPDDFYYASLYLAADARRAARALEATRRAIVEIPRECSDRGVAHLKLAWWQDEVTRLAAGAPRHPLTQALASSHARWPDLGVALEALIAATLASLAEPRAPHRAALLATLRAQHDAIAARYLDLGAAPPGDARETLQDLAARVELAHALRGLRQHRRGGMLYLADDALRAAGLNVEAVREARASTELEKLLGAECARLRDELRAGLAAVPRALRRAQALPVTLARCAEEALGLTLADGCRVLEQRVELLPTRKLWLAWRTRHLG